MLGANAAVIVTITEPALDAWRYSKFGEDANNSSIGGYEADPDGDGASNLMEYALGLDPLMPSVERLPRAGLTTMSGSTYLTLTYSYPANISGVVFQVEVSTDLMNWLSDPAAAAIQSETVADNIRTLMVRDSKPVTPGEMRFMRLKVTLP